MKTLQITLSVDVGDKVTAEKVGQQVIKAFRLLAGEEGKGLVAKALTQATLRVQDAPSPAEPITATVVAETGGKHHTIHILGEVVKQLGEQSHIPPSDIRQNRREYWKAGARFELANINKALRLAAAVLIGPDKPQPTDGQLFAYWVREAEHNPGRVAKALAKCVTMDDYRVALVDLMDDSERALLNDPVNVNGSVELV